MSVSLPKRVAENIRNFTGRSWLLERADDWLKDSPDQFFILTGEPGSVKSMVAAWLAGFGPLPKGREDKARLQRIRKAFKAIHFCLASSGDTEPRTIARKLSQQLQAAIPDFAGAVAKALEDRLHIDATLSAGPVAEGARVTNVDIGQINLAGWSDETSYNLLLRQPLINLYDGGYTQKTLLIVDALDEALTYSASPNIVQLLAKSLDLPSQVRILLTTRPDRRVLKEFSDVQPLDLIRDAPPDGRDVYDFLYSNLATFSEPDRAGLAERLTQAAEGNFLYAYLVLNDPRLQTRMPMKLGGIYQEFLNRELGANENRWRSEYRPVLGLVSVAQGDGLTAEQIELFTQQPAGDVLRICKQYLEGDLPDGPFRPFHRSFGEFLLNDPKNVDYHIDPASMHALIAAWYCPSPGCAGAWSGWDDYGMQHLVAHLAGAAERKSQAERHAFTESLSRLATDPAFQAIYLEPSRPDLLTIITNLELALSTAAKDTHPHGLPVLIKTALALSQQRRQLVQPQALFDAARRGDPAAALNSLPAFHLDHNWERVALGLLAWCAVPRNQQAARSLRDRLKREGMDEWPLPLFLERLSAALERREPSLPPLIDEHPAEEVVVQILKRMAGEAFNEGLVYEFMGSADLRFQLNEMLIEMTRNLEGQMPDDAPVFLSQVDGPVLVAFARDDPVKGTQALTRYLDLHAANNYVFYRNLSLWLLFDPVLRYPDQDWALEIAVRMAAIALTGEHMVFQNALPYAFAAWLAARGQPGWLETLQDHAAKTLAAAGNARVDGQNPYAMLHRQLAALAEAATLLPGAQGQAAAYFQSIEELGRGLAGYYAPAWLTLADTYRICQPGQPEKIDHALKRALIFAKNINNEVYCLRNTAEVNLIMRRPWESANPGIRIDQVIQQFCENPLDPRFGTLHIVGDRFDERENRPLSLLEGVNTLEGFANVYQQPLADFLRLNPEWKTGERIPENAMVRIPDPEFPPNLAAHFAACALADPGLTPARRVECIQRLLPIASHKQVPLDQVLARLLLAWAMLPTDPAVLDELAKFVPPPRLDLMMSLGPHAFPGPA